VFDPGRSRASDRNPVETNWGPIESNHGKGGKKAPNGDSNRETEMTYQFLIVRKKATVKLAARSGEGSRKNNKEIKKEDDKLGKCSEESVQSRSLIDTMAHEHETE